MKVYLEKDAIPIDYAHETDAGIDIRTPYDVTCSAHSSIVIDTGVHVEIPHGCAGVLVSKSGLNVRSGITSTGLIDEGYTGSIQVKLYNNSNRGYTFLRGEKITQLVIIPVEHVGIYCVESLEEFENSERGTNGFGSTGR